MKIAICDDEDRVRESIKMVLESAFSTVSLREFASGQELLHAVEQAYLPDIVLMDIMMDGMDGMETAKKLRKYSDMILIFVTGMKEQVFQAFDVGAFHYLLKPVEEEKLISVVSKAILEVKKNKASEKHMLIKAAGVYRNINVADILYAESDGRKVILHMKTEVLEFYEKMEELEQKLGEGFYRCHRSYLVALSKIRGYDSTSIVLSNGERIYLAKRKYSEFVRIYCSFLQEPV
ncbi:MAG: LytTR family DNA-binding domain-containing protein [Blautia sp.]|nr:LytTR family DNA-binding domain-containing protein [Lachnoclostridium sp.]MCM1212233.1 LytTR family DNA-binding domain-containing protein [Blautia sp.]